MTEITIYTNILTTEPLITSRIHNTSTVNLHDIRYLFFLALSVLSRSSFLFSFLFSFPFSFLILPFSSFLILLFLSSLPFSFFSSFSSFFIPYIYLSL